MSQMNLIINADICTGCRLCESICSLVKEKEVNPAKARIHNEVHLFEGMRIPRVCINCADPSCIPVCPSEALTKDEETGWVNLDYKKCTMCLLCVDACHYGGIRLSPEDKILKCDLCGGDPECVKFCEIGAISFAPREPQKLTQARKALEPLSSLKEVIAT